MPDLTGKVGIITGAASGMGRTYAVAAARSGAAVAVADIEDGSSVVEEILGFGGRAITAHVDVGDENSTRAMAGAALERSAVSTFSSTTPPSTQLSASTPGPTSPSKPGTVSWP